MSTPNPFKPAPFAPKGNEVAEDLHSAVGSALNIWEHAEGSFAHLFGTIIRPTRNSFVARRAYGAIITARARRDMLVAVAEVFFRNFPNEAAEETMRVLLKHYQDAASRRNELAHGIVGGDRDENSNFLGYFIVPSTWNTNKRKMNSEFSYRYSTKEILEKQNSFSNLNSQAISLADQLDTLFESSPEKLRERW